MEADKVVINGLTFVKSDIGLVYSPRRDDFARKYDCPDCEQCGFCSDVRCKACRANPG